MGIDMYFCKVVNEEEKMDLTIDYNDAFSQFENNIQEFGRDYVDTGAFKEKYGFDYRYDMCKGDYLYFYKDGLNFDLFDLFDIVDSEIMKQHLKLVLHIDDVPSYIVKEKVLYCKEIDYYRKGYFNDGVKEITNFIEYLNKTYDRVDITKKEFVDCVDKLEVNDLMKYKNVDFDVCLISY
jgi:hypothetical protein